MIQWFTHDIVMLCYVDAWPGARLAAEIQQYLIDDALSIRQILLNLFSWEWGKERRKGGREEGDRWRMSEASVELHQKNEQNFEMASLTLLPPSALACPALPLVRVGKEQLSSPVQEWESKFLYIPVCTIHLVCKYFCRHSIPLSREQTSLAWVAIQ